jgi:hypothetical protein
LERRAVTSNGPANDVPAIMASRPEMPNLKGNVTLSSRRTANDPTVGAGAGDDEQHASGGA